ncbi:MAG: rhodanese-related sulfurtransferase [Dehalococcoidia bacterium]
MAISNFGTNENKWQIASLYKFVKLKNVSNKRNDLQNVCEKHNIFGTLILAEEGFNGTITGERDSIDVVLDEIMKWPEVKTLEVKYSESSMSNFRRLKIKQKKEIVTMGRTDVDAESVTGEYISPKDWNDFVQRDDVILIDARNEYETMIGHFKNAIDPQTETFTEFPEWITGFIDQNLEDKKIAMYCTGGIRCEKASSYLKSKGIEDVYQLQGGILKYLEEVPEEDSLWEGECFVFDQRVSIKHDLVEGKYQLCFSCQFPVSNDDLESPFYEEGVTCKNCYDSLTEEQKISRRERQKQILLSRDRGEIHLGRDPKKH